MIAAKLWVIKNNWSQGSLDLGARPILFMLPDLIHVK